MSLEEIVHMKVVEKREAFHRLAVERGIITSEQGEALTMFFIEWLDKQIKED